VVVPSHNGRELLEWSLPALLADLASLPSAEAIVVDDHSSDGTVAWLQTEFPHVRVIGLETVRGFAAACNAGARVSMAPIVAFLNNDAEVLPGWGGALLTTLDGFPDAVIAGGVTRLRQAPDTVNSAGVRVTSAGAASDLGYGLPLHRVDLRPREVAGVSGVSMAVRADWFGAAGGFDESLFMYFEDVELCLRAWLEGHTVRLAPDSGVLHQGGASAGGRYRFMRNYLGSRNRLLVAAACLDGPAQLRAVPLLLGQDVLTVLWLALIGRPALAARTARARLRGTRDGLREFRAARSRRIDSRRRRTFADLRALGIIDTWRHSLREFARIRLRELTRGEGGA
jgi:GT2 family glycosyltransferase